MIDEKKLIEDITKSWVLDTHVTDEASRVHSQEHRHLLQLIKKQPKVGEWIPVEEALPKKTGCYIVTTKMEINQFHEPHYDVIEAKYWASDKTWEDTIDDFKLPNVIAWMPLPKPYEVQDET